MMPRAKTGDSVWGQGCAAPRSARLVLDAVQNRQDPRRGALRTHCALKHLSANGAKFAKGTTPKPCENAVPRAKNVFARQRVRRITP